MSNIFMIAFVIAIIFLLFKFVEMRLIEKESKPLKLLIRDALLVYLSVIAGYFMLDQLNPFIQNGGDTNITVTPVFTDNPGF